MRRAIIALACLLATPVAAQVKDPVGMPSPTVVPPSGTTRLYDSQGRFTGRAEERPNGSRFYDAQGRYNGRVETRPGGVLRHYDAEGRFIGQSRTQRR